MFPDLIKICSAVKLDGILLSYSLIGKPAQVNDFGRSINSVWGSIIFESKAAANVKVLKTEPNSYTPLVALLIKFTSEILFLLFGSKSGNETKDKISPFLTFIRIAALPFVLKISLNLINSLLIRYCISLSTVSFMGSRIFLSFLSNDFSKPEMPLFSLSIWPMMWLNRFFWG